MAIDKLTLFELNFDGARFGPELRGGKASDSEFVSQDGDYEAAETGTVGTSEAEYADADEGRRVRLLPFLVLVGVAFGARAALRRARSGHEVPESAGIDIEETETEESISA